MNDVLDIETPTFQAKKRITGIQPYFEVWALLKHDGTITDDDTEIGIGLVMGYDFGLLCDIRKDLLEDMQNLIFPKPKGNIIEFCVTDLSYNQGQYGNDGRCEIPAWWSKTYTVIHRD